MSNKLTSKTLDLLIEQVLNEKSVSVSITGKWLDDKKILGIKNVGNIDASSTSDANSKIADLADNDNVDADVSDKDLKSAFNSKSGPDFDVADFLRRSYSTPRDLRAAAQEEFSKVFPSAKSDQLDQEIGTSYNDKQSKQDVAKAIPDTDLDYYATKSKSDDDYKKFEPQKALASSTADVFESFFASSGADTVQKRIEELASFSELILNASKSNTGAIVDLNERGAQRIMNDAIIVKLLAKVSREVQGASAGTIFETFLAILLSGVITGGAGAAADLGIVGKPIYLSSKLTASSSGTQSAKNLHAELQVAGTIWYIVAKKIAAVGQVSKGQTSAIQIYLSGIQLEDNVAVAEGQWQKFTWINKAGDPHTTSQKRIAPNVSVDVEIDTNPDFTIYLGRPTLYAQGAQAFDKMFLSAVANLDDTIKTAIQEMSSVYQSSDKITQKMKSYVGKSDIDAGIEVKNTYTAMLATLNSVFDKITGTSTDTKKTQVDQIKGTLSEKNKNKSLKDLDKLIERVILKEMLKK
mgnify:CR=1 FL=1|tara:strand:+ start:2207 stop:3775 length:1569 start_codon:yes stop_codon:yes gene_type:complete